MPLPLLAIGALAKLAPIAIRAAGSMFGGNAEKAANAIANVVEGTGGSEAEVTKAIEAMPPELVIELERVANEAKRIDNERRARDQQHEETLSGQIQTTAQAEQQYGDSVSRRVRPETARESFRMGAVFSVCLLCAETYRPGLGFSEYTVWILGLLLSPCLAYFGVRSVDKWRGGATS